MNSDLGKHVKKLHFGPAGKPVGFKGRVEDVPKALSEMGLDALEVQQVRNINIKEEQAKKIREEAKKYKIILSVHGPYAVNLSSGKDEIIKNSMDRLLRVLKIAELMGAYVVVFHPGYYKDLGKEESLKKAIKVLLDIEEEAKSLGIKRVKLGAETTGKKTQLGDLDEVISMAQETDIVIPVIDFAHLHARMGGGFTKKKEYDEVLDKLEEHVSDKIKRLHIHFSKIEYTDKGEKRHHTFGSGYGPTFHPLSEALLERGIEAVIISESPVLEKDALRMKEISERIAFKKYKNKKDLMKLE